MVDLIATEYEAKCSALIVVVNAQADAQRSGSSVVIIGRTESTCRRSAPATTTIILQTGGDQILLTGKP